VVDREVFFGLLVPFRARTIKTDLRAGMVAMGEPLKDRVQANP
jgi:hypothetical protein